MVNMKGFTMPFGGLPRVYPKFQPPSPSQYQSLQPHRVNEKQRKMYIDLDGWITEKFGLNTTFQVEFVKYWISDILIFLRKVMQNFFLASN